MVARDRGIEYIIDDAILIHENKVIAGVSAKKAGTRIESVKRALFSTPEQVEEIQKVLKKEKPESILILGTSDEMVEKIVKNIGLPDIEETIYIEDVATPEQIAVARSVRMSEGKHVIPVPTFEIKKDFSGYLLDPLQIFKWKGKGTEPYVSEKSIIRPTFSYLGNYIISDNVIRTIAQKVAKDMAGIYKVQRVKVDSYSNGIMIYIDVIAEYSYNLRDVMKQYKDKLKREIDKLTAMNVLDIKIVAKGLHIPE